MKKTEPKKAEICPACDMEEVNNKCVNPLCVEGMAKKDVKDLTQKEANGLESFKKKAVEEIVSEVNKALKSAPKDKAAKLTPDDVFMDLFIVDYDNKEVNLEIKYGRTIDRTKYNTSSFTIPRKNL
jgi:hypothetical protein